MGPEWLLLLLPLVLLSTTITNLVTWRRGTPSSLAVSGSVSVLIPARNEERNIEAAIMSAAAEQAVGEIVVFDDGSTDRTAEMVRAWAARDARVRLVSGDGSLPAGWVGKTNALERLFREARGEWVVFMDADVRLHAGGVERLLSLATLDPHADVVTAVPRQLMTSFVERLVLPLLVLTYVVWLPLRFVERGRDGRLVAANGQLLATRRSLLDSLGGFSAVKAELVEDMALCRLAKRHGLRVVCADGFQMASCRMYQSGHEVFAGFSKNLYEGLGSPRVLVFAILLHVAAFLLPYGCLALGAAWPALGGLVFPAALSVMVAVGIRALLVVRFRQPPEGVLLHPLAVCVLIAIAINSYVWHRRGRVEWAGRSYAARPLRLAAESRP